MTQINIWLHIPLGKRLEFELPAELSGAADESIDWMCEMLAEEDDVVFEVSGFDLLWPVDISTDLAVILPQIPKVVRSLMLLEDASLEFYEQGIERRVVFRPSSGLVECRQLVGNELLGVVSDNSERVASMLSQVTLEFSRWARVDRKNFE